MHMSQKEKDIPLLRTAFEEANHWINEVADDLGDVPPKCAYHALRGVLFALRDRIPPEEAAHFGDQLPTFVRGIYYESYRHGGKPEKIRNLADFLEKIAHETAQADPAPDPAAALKTVSAVIASHIDEGQYQHVKHALPLEIQEEMA